jgi:hypothetical protein
MTQTSDLATSLVTANAQQTQSLIQIAVMKQQFKAEQSVLDILDPPQTQAPPSPGTGLVVDKTA